MNLELVPNCDWRSSSRDFKADGSWEVACNKLKTYDISVQHQFLEALAKHGTEVIKYHVHVITRFLRRLTAQKAMTRLVRYAFENRHARVIARIFRRFKRRRDGIVDSTVKYWSEQLQLDVKDPSRIRKDLRVVSKHEPLFRTLMHRTIPKPLKLQLVRELFSMKYKEYVKSRRKGTYINPPHRMRPEQLIVIDRKTRAMWNDRVAEYFGENVVVLSDEAEKELQITEEYRKAVELFLSGAAAAEEAAASTPEGGKDTLAEPSGSDIKRLSVSLSDVEPSEPVKEAAAGEEQEKGPAGTPPDEVDYDDYENRFTSLAQDLMQKRKSVFARTGNALPRHKSVIAAMPNSPVHAPPSSYGSLVKQKPKPTGELSTPRESDLTASKLPAIRKSQAEGSRAVNFRFEDEAGPTTPATQNDDGSAPAEGFSFGSKDPDDPKSPTSPKFTTGRGMSVAAGIAGPQSPSRRQTLRTLGDPKRHPLYHRPRDKTEGGRPSSPSTPKSGHSALSPSAEEALLNDLIDDFHKGEDGNGPADGDPLSLRQNAEVGENEHEALVGLLPATLGPAHVAAPHNTNTNNLVALPSPSGSRATTPSTASIYSTSSKLKRRKKRPLLPPPPPPPVYIPTPSIPSRGSPIPMLTLYGFTKPQGVRTSPRRSARHAFRVR